MAKQSRQREGKKFSGNHQRSWLWGFHAVTETLAAGKWPVHEVLATEPAYSRASALLEEKRQQGIAVQLTTAERLRELVHTTEHQGLLARLGPFPYADLQTVEQQLTQAMHTATQPPLIVLCDRLQDSFNMGAILRCCASATVLAVIVGSKSQAEMSSHVVRSSAGVINHMTIARSEDLVATATRLKSLGLRLLAADSNAANVMWDADLRHPAVLIIGSEAHGVDEQLLRLCDQRLVIPMDSRVNSLNAAVASGILLYEIRRQQRDVLP